MRLRPLMRQAAANAVEIVESIRPEQLAAATPCQDYDVRALVNHLRFWAPSLAAAGRGQVLVVDPAKEQATDLTTDDWQAGYTAQIEDLVDAWGTEKAWQGTTSMGGSQLPAEFCGAMVFVEFVVHGWDLAAATGQNFRCGEDVAAETLAAVVGMAEQGRTGGVFGEPVPVEESAPALDRALGISGRDPRWVCK